MVGGHATVGRLSNNVFWTFQAIWKFFEKSHWTVTRQWSEVTRPSDRLSNNVFSTFQAVRRNFEKSHWTVTWQWSVVTLPSADCQTTFFRAFQAIKRNFLKKVTERSRDSGRRSRDRLPTVKQRFFRRFKQFGEILKKVTERSHDSGRRSRDRWPTVKQRFFGRFKQLGDIFWKKSLNGHATVVGGHATVGRLSNNVFWTSQAIMRNFLKKVAERSRDSGRRSHDLWPTAKQRFFHVSSSYEKFFEKSHWTVTWQWSVVTLPSADCQTTFFGRFKQFGEIFWKKSLNGHATVVGGHATVGRLSNNVFRCFKRLAKFLWKVTEWSRDSDRRSRDRRLTVKHIYAWIRERERKRERERERDGERESTLQDHVIYNKMRIALRICLPDNFPVCWPPGPSSLCFSRESPAGDMWCYVAYVYNGNLFHS